ncbi:MAG: 30S ribosomal protein S2 [Chloroflexi bacterium]|nr:30S ribosomal protein S2 [Chloroflexota bacterium]
MRAAPVSAAPKFVARGMIWRYFRERIANVTAPVVIVRALCAPIDAFQYNATVLWSNKNSPMTTTQAQAEQSPPITLRGLLEAGAHFGHPTKRWHPKMKPYIFTARNKIHVFDLAKTMEKLEIAAEFVDRTVGTGGQVMLVGTKKQAQEAISDVGQRTGALYVNQRWLGGMMTNFQTIQKRIEYVVRLEDEIANGTLKVATKREAQRAATEVTRLNKFLGGIKHMTTLPRVLFIVDIGKEKIAVAEAKRLGIPVVAIVDTNCDPTGIDYPIPANDDAIRSVRLITERIGDAIVAGNAKRRARAAQQMELDAEIEQQEEAARRAAQEEAATRQAVAVAARRQAEETAALTAAASATEEAEKATTASTETAPTAETVAVAEEAPAAEVAVVEPVAAVEEAPAAGVAVVEPVAAVEETPAAEVAADEPVAAVEETPAAEVAADESPAVESTDDSAQTEEDKPAE